VGSSESKALWPTSEDVAYAAVTLTALAWIAIQYVRITVLFRQRIQAANALCGREELRGLAQEMRQTLHLRLSSYLIAFIVCQLPGAVHQVVRVYAPPPAWLVLLRACTQPLQGVVNALVYWQQARRPVSTANSTIAAHNAWCTPRVRNYALLKAICCHLSVTPSPRSTLNSGLLEEELIHS